MWPSGRPQCRGVRFGTPICSGEFADAEGEVVARRKSNFVEVASRDCDPINDPMAHATETFAEIQRIKRSSQPRAAKHADIRRILEELIEHLERDAPASKELPRARRVLDRLDNLVEEWTPDAGLTDPIVENSAFFQNWRAVSSGETFRSQKRSNWRLGR
jgi:hypothetical protein